MVENHDPQYESLDPELLGIARILKESTCFTRVDDEAPLYEKQMIFLAAAGVKPVSEASSGHWQSVPGGRKTVPDDEQDVKLLLDHLGLFCRLSNDDHVIHAAVSLSDTLLDTFLTTTGTAHPALNGLLYGFPPSAAMAFALQKSTDFIDLDPVLDANGLRSLSVFRFSRAWSDEELRVLKFWHRTLVKYGLD